MERTGKHRPMLNGVVVSCAQVPGTFSALSDPNLETELSSLVDEIHRSAEAIIRSRGGRFALRIIAVEEATSGGRKIDLVSTPAECEADSYVFQKKGRESGELWSGLKKIYTY